MIKSLLVLNGIIKNDYNHWLESYLHNLELSNDFIILNRNENTFINRLFSKLRFPLLLKSNFNLLKRLLKNDYQIIILIKPNSILPFILKLKKNAFVVSIPVDNMIKSHNRSYFFQKTLKYSNLIFINTGYKKTEKFYRINSKSKILFWDRSYSNFHHSYKNINVIYKYDILFVGTYEKIRMDYFQYLCEKGLKIDVFGNGWEKANSNNKNLIIHNKALLKEDYINSIRSAKINLNFLRKIQDDTQTMRTFEIPACGGFMITERTDCHTRIFKEDFESVFFDNKEELYSKIIYYMVNDSKRKEIIRNARKKLSFGDTYCGKIKILTEKFKEN